MKMNKKQTENSFEAPNTTELMTIQILFNKPRQNYVTDGKFGTKLLAQTFLPLFLINFYLLYLLLEDFSKRPIFTFNPKLCRNLKH
jgi:hypothetical protein